MAGDLDRKSRDPEAAQEAIQKSSNVNLEKAAMGAIDIDAKITVYVALACLVAASGGVLFGYDGAATGPNCPASTLQGCLTMQQCHTTNQNTTPPHFACVCAAGCTGGVETFP
jgi:hypothetical protein